MNWTAIFKSGTHEDSHGRKRTWTIEELDRIVWEYNQRNEKAPLVLGHPQSNGPAQGWIHKLRRSRDVLEACFERVTNEVKEAVRSGHYKYKSISLNLDGTLRHVGLLGAAPPAVSGLGPIEFSSDDDFLEFSHDEVFHFDLTKYV